MLKSDEESKDDKETKDTVIVDIDLEGLSERIVALDIPSDSYAGLARGPKTAVFAADSDAKLHIYDLTKIEQSEYASGVDAAVTSAYGAHMLYIRYLGPKSYDHQ